VLAQIAQLMQMRKCAQDQEIQENGQIRPKENEMSSNPQFSTIHSLQFKLNSAIANLENAENWSIPDLLSDAAQLSRDLATELNGMYFQDMKGT
jgi:hypothetical protein